MSSLSISRDEESSQFLSNSTDGREDSPLLPSSIPPTIGSRCVYFCFLFLGLGTLLPWNFFITADPYWQYKFRNVTGGDNNNITDDSDGKTELQSLYTPLLVCLSQGTNFSFLFINALFSHLVAHRKRLIYSLTLMICFFFIATVMVKLNSDSWQLEFFIVTMFIIMFLAGSGAIFQGSLMGVAGMFPETFMCAVGAGMSLGGVFAAVARILSLVFGGDDVSSAFIYFLIALVVMFFTMISYLYVSSTRFFKYYYDLHHQRTPGRPNSGNSLFGDDLYVFKEIWPVGLSLCFVFVVTLSVFPVMTDRIISSSSNKTWANIYFQPVASFLLFNVGDYFSRHVAGLIMWPRRGSKLIYLVSASRIIFIPLFLLCNHDATSPIPSVFTHDAWFIVFMIFFSLSNGYLFALCMMYAPKMVVDEDSEKAGTMMAAMIGLGLLIGAGLSFAVSLMS